MALARGRSQRGKQIQADVTSLAKWANIASHHEMMIKGMRKTIADTHVAFLAQRPMIEPEEAEKLKTE